MTHFTAAAASTASVTVRTLGAVGFAAVPVESRGTLARPTLTVAFGAVHATTRSQAIRSKVAVGTAGNRAVRAAESFLTVTSPGALVATFRVRSAVTFVLAVGPVSARTAFLVTVSAVVAGFALAVTCPLVTLSVLRMAVAVVFAIFPEPVVGTLSQVSG